MTTQLPHIFIGLLTLGGALWHAPAALGEPPIKVNLAFEKDTYSLQGTPESIRFAVTVENTASEEILASDGFQHEPLHLLVTFVGPDGKGVTAPQLSSDEQVAVPPPRILPVGDQYVQVDPLVRLAPRDTNDADGIDTVATIEVPDAHSFYTLNQCGHYTAKVSVPLRLYPTVNHTFGGIDYADLDSANFAGVVASDPVSFTLTDDRDGDQSLCPEDCDDNNAALRPGATEIVGDGVDNDCNPATLDVVPVVPGGLEVKAVKKKIPLDGVVVRLFDKKASCVTQFKGRKRLRSIWLSCLSQFDGPTGQNGPGALSLQLPPGDYLLLAEYDPDSTPLNDNEQLLGIAVGKIKSGKIKKGKLSFKEKKASLASEGDTDDVIQELSESEDRE
jgi:hypothetical protein